MSTDALLPTPSDYGIEEQPEDGKQNTARKVSGLVELASFDDTSNSEADEVVPVDDGAIAPPFPPEPVAEEESTEDDPTMSLEGAGVASLDPQTLNGVNSSFFLWNEFFDDPQLVSLIGLALVGNQELKILNEEIWIANNEVDARSGEYLPFVTLGGGVGIDKASRYTRAGAVEEALEVAPGRSFPDPLPDFLMAANVSWEVDIWRKLRNARDAASFRYLGTRDGQNYIQTRLVAEIAEKYYDLLALDNRMATLDLTIAIQKQSLRIAEVKKANAAGTELAVQRFQAEVRKNESEKLVLQQEIIEVENRINFLLGRYPQPVERRSIDFINLELNPLNVGVPAQLLSNRPDVRQAERELAAAGLDIEVARARFYPSLDITAGLGYQAFNPEYLFVTPEALIYNLAGDLVGPLINKRAIQAEYRSANAKQIQAVYNYQRTVLNAYTEVVNNMSKVQNYGESIESRKQQIQALETSVQVATQLFDAARAEYVEVLLAQREMMEARMVLIDAKRQQLSAVINTYQALGGGAPVAP
ncbi:MAG: efflux transporter outer membrane subunit [Planctomycetaceae bacterium]